MSKKKVTKDNFADLLLESVEEALAHTRGEIELKTTKVELRRCNYCKKDTLTIEEDCSVCGFSKPYKDEIR